MELTVTLSDDAIERLAERVAARLDARTPLTRHDWYDVNEAAEHLRCKPQRIYDLVSAGKLRVAKDGTRSLFRRVWLDNYLESSR